MQRNYVVDTSVLLDDENAIEILRNGEENKVYIPYTVLLELNHLKKDKRLCFSVNKVVRKIEDDKKIILMRSSINDYSEAEGDLRIIEEVLSSCIEDPVIVTNDILFRVMCTSKGILNEEFKCSTPFFSESQLFTGFQKEGETPVPNAFTWIRGIPCFNHPNGEYVPIEHQNTVWGVKPLNEYQNLAFELLLNNDIDLTTIQSKAGLGKSYLALAVALYKVLQEKRYNKIYLVKPTIEVGDSLGFLPGSMEEKVDPYVRYLRSLIWKLHNTRGSKCSRLFTEDSSPSKLKLNPELFEILPIQYVRGMNIEDSFVIVDETQNLSRVECRSLLTRMGHNTKCVCLGDVEQIDNRYLNTFNNGLNWIVKQCKGEKNYAHLVLKGNKSRGPVCDMILKTGL